MALLLVLLALFSFVGFGIGTGSTGTGVATRSAPAIGRNSARTAGVSRTTCIVVSWKLGEPAHRRPCRKP